VYRFTVMSVCYCNVLLQYSCVKGYFYVCVTVMCCYSTVVCRVTVIYVCYSNVLLQFSCVQVYIYVCYCNVLLQYSQVQGYCYVRVLP
jgi:hypothetical protein